MEERRGWITWTGIVLFWGSRCGKDISEVRTPSFGKEKGADVADKDKY